MIDEKWLDAYEEAIIERSGGHPRTEALDKELVRLARLGLRAQSLKTQVIVKLEMLRGCCNTASITKKQIGASVQEFIKKLESQ